MSLKPAPASLRDLPRPPGRGSPPAPGGYAPAPGGYAPRAVRGRRAAANVGVAPAEGRRERGPPRRGDAAPDRAHPEPPAHVPAAPARRVHAPSGEAEANAGTHGCAPVPPRSSRAIDRRLRSSRAVTLVLLLEPKSGSNPDAPPPTNPLSPHPNQGIAHLVHEFEDPKDTPAPAPPAETPRRARRAERRRARRASPPRSTPPSRRTIPPRTPTPPAPTRTRRSSSAG